MSAASPNTSCSSFSFISSSQQAKFMWQATRKVYGRANQARLAQPRFPPPPEAPTAGGPLDSSPHFLQPSSPSQAPGEPTFVHPGNNKTTSGTDLSLFENFA